MSDEVILLVVSYLYEGTYHATLHVSTCGILRRVEAQTSPDPRFPGQMVLTPDQYARRPGAEHRQPKQHACVAKHLKESSGGPQPALI